MLEEDGLLLVDRLGFAVTFLDDAALETFMEREWEGMSGAGRLEGLVLSGGDQEGVQLLQSFVDRTADVQTVSWMAVKVLSLELAKSDQVTAWIESYRTLLDQWNMFSVRAELDIALTNAGCNSQPFQQVSAVLLSLFIKHYQTLSNIITHYHSLSFTISFRCSSAATTAASPSPPGTRGCPRGARPAACPGRAAGAATSPRCRPAHTARSVAILYLSSSKLKTKAFLLSLQNLH